MKLKDIPLILTVTQLEQNAI